MSQPELDLLDSYTAVKLRDLALIKIQSQAVAEALRVLVTPSNVQTYLERRAAFIRAREVLAAFDAMPNVLEGPAKPVSTLCAVCDQIKELHPDTHPWTPKP